VGVCGGDYTEKLLHPDKKNSCTRIRDAGAFFKRDV
jgi:hypothetical protein